MKEKWIRSEDAVPIIQLWGNLLVPLQGEISDSQAERLHRDLLQRLRTSEATGLVVDVSGVSMIDSHLCAQLSKWAGAAEFMGVTAVICGLSPEIVMTLQAMDIDLTGMESARSLEEALERVGIHPDGGAHHGRERTPLDVERDADRVHGPGER
jgi:rsbT antagonist protein RsbS